VALNIKDPETDRLARELAERTGTSITEALKTALKHELAATRVLESHRPDRAARIQAIIDRGRARPLLNNLTEDEILGYDEHGLPS
jgi:antitoxin VapB